MKGIKKDLASLAKVAVIGSITMAMLWSIVALVSGKPQHYETAIASGIAACIAPFVGYGLGNAYYAAKQAVKNKTNHK